MKVFGTGEKLPKDSYLYDWPWVRLKECCRGQKCSSWDAVALWSSGGRIFMRRRWSVLINVNIVTMDYINIVTMDIMCFITMDNKNIVTMDNKNIVNMDYKISVTTENTNIITLNTSTLSWTRWSWGLGWSEIKKSNDDNGTLYGIELDLTGKTAIVLILVLGTCLN